MSDTFQQRLNLLHSAPLQTQLTHIIRGIEKEGLRTSAAGKISQSPHPKSLGSALTHPSITTDYSEALLEFITPALESPQAAIDYLREVHSYAYDQLDNELIWPASMPCILDGENSIPIAEYGSSNSGALKHAYRIGLAHRYGKTMQAIAGVHYNFSLPTAFWPLYKASLQTQASDQDFQTEQYFALIRNFHRYSWLTLYLFGASPALCTSFMESLATDSSHHLDTLDKDTLYSPEATSLRMSDLGYQNDAQQGINVCYNSLERYVDGLGKAINTVLPAYQTLGIKVDGEYRQLNANVLQIENEYYSDIRPKRVTPSCQKPLHILAKEGVEYIEVRNLDINPLLPVGIDEQQIRFMDAFLLFCLLEESPSCEAEQEQLNVRNKALVVNHGRSDNLQLHINKDSTLSLRDWGSQLLAKIAQVADLLDNAHGQQDGSLYRDAVAAQQSKFDDASLTPSAQLLAIMEKGSSFSELCIDLANQHKQYFKTQPRSAAAQSAFKQQTLESLQAQAEIEAADTLSFDDFLARYNAL
ncbi:MAG: glutamate--cysteine ligase [Pseudomonadales bacterium]